MKSSKWVGWTSFTLLVLLFVVSPTARARAEAAWEILFNGSVSKQKVVATDSGDMVPVYFKVPDDGESQSYGVLIETDGKKGQIKITRVKKKSITQRGDCPKCDGSEKCQDCYPAGSGENTSGYECYGCNATGDCPFCQGSGDCYTCGGGGMPNGCNTCGDNSN